MIVAIYKLDKQDSKSQKVREELIQQEVLVDDMGGDAQAGAKPENRAGVLGDVGLEKRYLHGLCEGCIGGDAGRKCLNKTSPAREFVHGTLPRR